MKNRNKNIFKIMKKQIIAIILILSANLIFAQDFKLERIEPANWWAGMKNNNLQLLVHGKDISKADITTKSEDVIIKSVVKVDNPNYLFVNLRISETAKPGKFALFFKSKTKSKTFDYELKTRKNVKRGFSSSDLIYLLMPDRFANGDYSNDSPKSMLEKANRKNPDGRHGGDIQGVINHLDYIKELDVCMKSIPI